MSKNYIGKIVVCHHLHHQKVLGIILQMKTFFALYTYGIYKYYTHELFHILYTRHKNSFCQLFNNLVKLLLQFKKFVISPRLEHCYSCKLQKPLTNLPFTFCILNEDICITHLKTFIICFSSTGKFLPLTGILNHS